MMALRKKRMERKAIAGSNITYKERKRKENEKGENGNELKEKGNKQWPQQQ
jgi:hypothetical protein